MRPIGFSTGALALGDFWRALGILERHPAVQVVELSALRETELEPLVAALDRLNLTQFTCVAFHAPSAIGRANEAHVVELLGKVAARGWPIVVHPDAINEWALWRQFGELLCVENMDKRKPIGRSRAELHACFDRLPRASLCLDLGHARQVDPTMTEAYLILRDFKDRLRHVHLSEVSTDSRHDRLSYTASLAFREVAPFIPAGVPVLLETPIDEAQLALELRRARDALPLPAERCDQRTTA